MLGINSKRNPITGKFAVEIKQQVRRIQLGKLNERDCKAIRENRSLMERHNVLWE